MKQVVAIAATILIVTVSAGLRAEVVTEAYIGGGYESNLFNDSNATSDQYATLGANLKYYPSGSLQLTGAARYNAFSTYTDLSNFTGELSATFVPTPVNSPFTMSIQGSFAGRTFGTTYQLYDQTAISAGVNASYRLTPKLHVLSSVSYGADEYTNSEYGSSRSLDASAGLNATLPGSNSLAVGFDYTHRALEQADLLTDNPGHGQQANSNDNSDYFDLTGVRVRLSRPLGQRTGISLSVGHRQLHVDNNFTALGYTIDYLSPWADLWQGLSISGSVKHFFPHQFVVELSGAYFDKEFVDVLELDDEGTETYWADSRDDRLTVVNLKFSRPISLKDNTSMTPTVQLGYRRNESTVGYFDYEDLTATLSLGFTL